jgi:hypothetical protein
MHVYEKYSLASMAVRDTFLRCMQIAAFASKVMVSDKYLYVPFS